MVLHDLAKKPLKVILGSTEWIKSVITGTSFLSLFAILVYCYSIYLCDIVALERTSHCMLIFHAIFNDFISIEF